MFVDTGAWVGVLNRRDSRHAETVSRYRELSAAGVRLLTSNYVVDETATNLRYEVGLRAALGFRRMVLAAISQRILRVAWIDDRMESDGWQLLEQYADVKLSLTDATSAAVARRAKIGEVFGLDADFEALGFVVLPGRSSC